MVLDATKKAAAQATTSVSNLSVPVKVLASILIFAIGIAFTAGTIWISLLGRMDSLQEQGKDTKSIMLLQGQEVREDLDTVIENQEAFDVAQDMMLKEISKGLGLQIIMISHIPELISCADKVIEVSIEKGVSTAKEMTIIDGGD